MSNATLALQACVEMLIEGGVEVDLPSWTFTATAAAVIAAGAKPNFLDVDEEWRVLLNGQNSLLVDVLPFGTGLRTSNSQKTKTIIDGAASFDALRGCGKILQSESILVLSMHATKLIGAGEGAICIVRNEAWAERLRAWSNFGFESGSRISVAKGTNAKLSEYASAVALASLDKWSESRDKLQKIQKRVFEISAGFNLKLAPPMSDEHITPYWIIEFESGLEKEHAVSVLAKCQIETRDWWEKGCHQMEAYSRFSVTTLKQTELIAARSLGLPFHAFMTNQDFDKLEIAFRSL
jgi:dTDP-4-amino-4,6-dideoxygalactose transaminase